MRKPCIFLVFIIKPVAATGGNPISVDQNNSVEF